MFTLELIDADNGEPLPAKNAENPGTVCVANEPDTVITKLPDDKFVNVDYSNTLLPAPLVDTG